MPKLLIVLVISLLFLIVVVGLLRISKMPQTSSPSLTEANLKRLAGACKNFKNATGAWPTNLAQLRLYVPTTAQGMFRDEWGHDIVLYFHTNSTIGIWLESYGRQAAPGSNAAASIRLQ